MELTKPCRGYNYSVHGTRRIQREGGREGGMLCTLVDKAQTPIKVDRFFPPPIPVRITHFLATLLFHETVFKKKTKKSGDWFK